MQFSFAVVLFACCFAASQAFSFRNRELRAAIIDETDQWKPIICNFLVGIITWVPDEEAKCEAVNALASWCGSQFASEYDCDDNNISESGTDKGQGFDPTNPLVDTTTTEASTDVTESSDTNVDEKSSSSIVESTSISANSKHKLSSKKSKNAYLKSKDAHSKSKGAHSKSKNALSTSKRLNRKSKDAHSNSKNALSKSKNLQSKSNVNQKSKQDFIKSKAKNQLKEKQ